MINKLNFDRQKVQRQYVSWKFSDVRKSYIVQTITFLDWSFSHFQHLGFVHCPIREHCHAFPNCTDSLVERIVAKKATSSNPRPTSWASKGFGDNNHLNLVILGGANLTGTLERQVKALCNDEDEFMYQDDVFSLDYRSVSGDVSLPENAFRTQDFLPHGKTCFVYLLFCELNNW